jgi:hypothetical protein
MWSDLEDRPVMLVLTEWSKGQTGNVGINRSDLEDRPIMLVLTEAI